MPTMFRIVFAIIVNDVALFVAHTQAVTFCANDLTFVVVRPTFGLVNSFSLDLQSVPTFSGQTFPESVPELAVNEFPILSRMITPLVCGTNNLHSRTRSNSVWKIRCVAVDSRCRNNLSRNPRSPNPNRTTRTAVRNHIFLELRTWCRHLCYPQRLCTCHLRVWLLKD
jgi:hypothetical protein